MTSAGIPHPDTSRLPTYRFTQVARYHPYTMRSRRRGEDRLMTTVDYRERLEPILEEPENVHLRPIVLCDEYSDGDVSTLNLDAAALSDKHSDDRDSAGTNATKKVAEAFVDMIFVLRRRYLALLAVTNFLRTREANLRTIALELHPP